MTHQKNRKKLYDKYKFDKDKFNKLFSSTENKEKNVNNYLLDLATDLKKELQIKLPKQRKKQSKPLRDLEKIKKSFPPKKEASVKQENNPINTLIEQLPNDAIKEPTVNSLIKKSPKIAPTKAHRIALPNKAKKESLISSLFSKIKPLFTASNKAPLTTKDTDKIKEVPGSLQSKTIDEKTLKERESKVTDLLNKKGNVT
jgi:hypothetical protein